jgi:hypothetical protein
LFLTKNKIFLADSLTKILLRQNFKSGEIPFLLYAKLYPDLAPIKGGKMHESHSFSLESMDRVIAILHRSRLEKFCLANLEEIVTYAYKEFGWINFDPHPLYDLDNNWKDVFSYIPELDEIILNLESDEEIIKIEQVGIYLVGKNIRSRKGELIYNGLGHEIQTQITEYLAPNFREANLLI